ncbi:hypothetical protein MKW94_028454 [Papaver nudicaule]|uniref:Peptidase A1 domain-containing protein n=1 Tax=Papaver nudicaule TaxID=74823 RepID=A0AA41VF12_PAPNU|nr:hypothetical protein [Papaver nudicaule]
MASSSNSSALLPPPISMVVLILLSCLISTSFSLRVISDHIPNTQPLGFTVRVIHRDSPESPFYDTKLTDADRLRNAILRSFDRYNHYTSKSKVPDALRAPISFQYPTFEYVISHHIGTPPVHTYSVIDTGSELSWLQCRPCVDCYDQILPIFDPSKSTSYAKVGCKDNICKVKQGSICDEDGISCLYKLQYADTGHSLGILSSETFTFQHDSSIGNISILNFPFGCGHDNSFPYINSSHLGAPGLIGLNKEPLSLVSKLSFERFSHCFVLKSLINKNSLLRFGIDANITADTTPMIDYGSYTHGNYYVVLEGISVGKTKLNIPEGTFEISTLGEGGVIIDTGTGYTHLVTEAYDPFIAEVEKQIKLERRPPYESFPYCYKIDTTAGEMSMPDITFHFSGLNFVLQKRSVWKDVGDDKVCLTVLKAGGYLTIIGAQHLQNVNVGYDLKNQVISLLNRDCTQ